MPDTPRFPGLKLADADWLVQTALSVGVERGFPPLAVAVGQALGLDALPAPVVEEMAALKDLTRIATRGQWDRAAAVHCLCGVP